MKVCGITMRAELIPGRNETRDSLDRRLSLWVQEAGLQPLPIPNIWLLRPDRLTAWLEAAEVSIVILSGGGDVGDDPERDFTERGLLEYARVNRLPLLGICRGMQVMGVNAGGKLIRVAGHVGGRHQISGEMAGEVTSFHEKALANCPPDYRETGRSEDGVLEAIRHRILPWEGWMWHPEREDPFAGVWFNKVRNLAA